MAIRLRKIQGEWIALCAAKSKACKADVYLNDGIHYALACKFTREHDVDWEDEHVNKLMDFCEREL